MKPRWVLAMLVLVLAGCGEYAGLGGGRCRRGLCVKIEVMEPIRWGESLTVKIIAMTEADIPDLGVSIYTYPPDVAVEGPVGWESISRDGMVWKGGAGWLVAVKANQPVVFIRKIRVPEKEGLIRLQANVSTREGRRISHSVSIYFTREGGRVYGAETPVPITPWPLPVYIITSDPSPTPPPTFTPMPALPPTPTSPRSPLALPTPLAPPFIPPLPPPTLYP
jgi:hypothetical protein